MSLSYELAKQLGERYGITPDEAREDVILFAYANAHMENASITLDMVRQAAANLEQDVKP